MKKIWAFITSLLCITGLTIQAQDRIVPPDNSKYEDWEMKYDLYRYLICHELKDHDLTRKVMLARAENDIFLYGIFPSQESNWVKGSIKDGKIIISNSQKINDELNFAAGVAEVDTVAKFRREYKRQFVFFKPRDSIIFEIDNKGDYIGVTQEANMEVAIWAHKDSKRTLSFHYNEYSEEIHGEQDMYVKSWTGFPDADYYVNIRFTKLGDNGVDIVTDRLEPSDETTYDLQGRAVNPDNLRPGIYIRAGKKIIVR